VNQQFSPEYEKAIEAQQKVATTKGEAESICVVAQEQAKTNEVLSILSRPSSSVIKVLKDGTGSCGPL
jgi:hypothetical protein